MKTFLSAVLVTLLVTVTGARAQKAPPTGPQYHDYSVSSGVHDNSTADEIVAYSKVIEGGDSATKMRIHFKSHQLGKGSYVRLTSLQDYGRQELDTRSMGYWYDTSAIFNGNRVLLEVRVAPGDQGVSCEVDQLVIPCDCGPKVAADSFLAQTLCGADSRVASGDNRVGRINGCTAWLVSNGAVLTAGHCAPLAAGDTFEVNVPASTSSGGGVASAPADQFPINAASAVFVNGGSGNDFCVFRINPNGTTGQRPHVQHGFFRMSRETPVLATTIRVTGFGIDNSPLGTGTACCNTDSNGNCTHPRCNSQSRTLQTSTGGFAGEVVVGASDVSHTYATDTEPANSGSPIIWETTGFAIGIHTHGGCNSDGSGSNSGTSFEHNGLESALQNFPGANTRYLDFATYPNAPAVNGTIFQPFHTLATAVASVPSGGVVSIVEGSYVRTTAGNTGVFGTGNKAMMLEAPVGTVVIGN
jgi:V8-like Glu-specific endopeptidase